MFVTRSSNANDHYVIESTEIFYCESDMEFVGSDAVTNNFWINARDAELSSTCSLNAGNQSVFVVFNMRDKISCPFFVFL